jgi:hypothetical protein
VVLNVKSLGTSTIAGVGLGVLTEWFCSLNLIVVAFSGWLVDKVVMLQILRVAEVFDSTVSSVKELVKSF